MKHFFTLAAAALISAGSIAQTQHIPARYQHVLNDPQWATHFREQLLKKQQAHAAQKTTTLKKRVIAESDYDLTGSAPVLTDSTHYKYSGANGSKYNPGSYSYYYSFPALLLLGGDQSGYTHIDVMADSIQSYTYDASVPSLDVYEIIAATFTGTGKVDSYDDSQYGNFPGRYHYNSSYDAQDRLTQMLEVDYDDVNAQWDSVGKTTYVYDAQGHITRDSLFEYDPNEADWILWGYITHAFDANGNELETALHVDAGSGFITAFKGQMTYYSNNTMQTLILSQYSSSLQPIIKDSFAYTPGIDFATETWEYQYASGNWAPDYRNTLHVNNQSMPDTITYYTWNAGLSDYELSNKMAFDYDSDNNPLLWKQYLFTSGNPVPQDQSIHYFYYEEYNTTGVPDVAKTTITMYPNPATDHIQLSWKEGINKTVNVDIRNAAGQLMQQQAFTWKQETESISLKNMTPGIYWISVRDQQGVIYTQQIVKN